MHPRGEAAAAMPQQQSPGAGPGEHVRSEITKIGESPAREHEKPKLSGGQLAITLAEKPQLVLPTPPWGARQQYSSPPMPSSAGVLQSSELSSTSGAAAPAGHEYPSPAVQPMTALSGTHGPGTEAELEEQPKGTASELAQVSNIRTRRSRSTPSAG